MKAQQSNRRINIKVHHLREQGHINPKEFERRIELHSDPSCEKCTTEETVLPVLEVSPTKSNLAEIIAYNKPIFDKQAEKNRRRHTRIHFLKEVKEITPEDYKEGLRTHPLPDCPVCSQPQQPRSGESSPSRTYGSVYQGEEEEDLLSDRDLESPIEELGEPFEEQPYNHNYESDQEELEDRRSPNSREETQLNEDLTLIPYSYQNPDSDHLSRPITLIIL